MGCTSGPATNRGVAQEAESEVDKSSPSKKYRAAMTGEGRESSKQYVDHTKEGRKTKTQESREMPTLEVVEEEEKQETPKLLLELADRETQVYCICQRPYSARKYYIQCMLCQGWFHPRCLEQSRAECEAQRRTGGWTCGRESCKQAEQERMREKEKEE